MNTGKRLRILEIYAVVSILVFGVLAVSGFTQTNQKFVELTVERLNVVEPDGRLRTVIANTPRMPDPIVNGKTFKTERPAGLIWYSELGDECGGLVFGAVSAGNKYGAYGGLTIDQYKQTQTIGLMYNDHTGSRHAGLNIWDRPEIPLSDLVEKREALDRMPEGAAKEAARKSFQEAGFSPIRLFAGKSKESEVKVALSDAKGRVRINMVVDASGTPRLDFLDEAGKVVSSLPAQTKSKK
jgi:hypothetical protein